MCKHGGFDRSFSSLCPPRKFWQNDGQWWYINNVLYVPLDEEVTWYKIREMRWLGNSAISQSISMETFSARGSVLLYENVEVFHYAGITYYKGSLLPSWHEEFLQHGWVQYMRHSTFDKIH